MIGVAIILVACVLAYGLAMISYHLSRIANALSKQSNVGKSDE